MIVDVHAHAWRCAEHFGEGFLAQFRRAYGKAEASLATSAEEYFRGAPTETIAVVFGGKARLSGLWVDDEHVAREVARSPRRMIGFLSLDPTQDGWRDELRRGHRELGLCGIKLLPMYAGFSPDDGRLDPLWRYAQDQHLPTLLHTGTTFIAQAPLECSLPRHVDTVAIRFPEARIVLAHLAHPFEHECVAVIRKHPHVYADISALYYRPFQLYHSLMLVQEYGVWDKLLFGTDYPVATVDATIDGLRRLNEMLEGTALPRLDTDQIERLIHRNALAALGLPTPSPPPGDLPCNGT